MIEKIDVERKFALPITAPKDAPPCVPAVETVEVLRYHILREIACAVSHGGAYEGSIVHLLIERIAARNHCFVVVEDRFLVGQVRWGANFLCPETWLSNMANQCLWTGNYHVMIGHINSSIHGAVPHDVFAADHTHHKCFLPPRREMKNLLDVENFCFDINLCVNHVL